MKALSEWDLFDVGDLLYHFTKLFRSMLVLLQSILNQTVKMTLPFINCSTSLPLAPYFFCTKCLTIAHKVQLFLPLFAFELLRTKLSFLVFTKFSQVPEVPGNTVGAQ